MIENQYFSVLSINICQSVIFLRTLRECFSTLGNRFPGEEPLPLSSQSFRPLFGQLELHQGFREAPVTVQKPAEACVQSNHPSLGSLMMSRGCVLQGAPHPGFGVGNVRNREHMQCVHGQEFLTKVVSQLRSLFEERHGHSGVPAGI
jgi:hypothetical protein